jgi:hypothetical protein
MGMHTVAAPRGRLCVVLTSTADTGKALLRLHRAKTSDQQVTCRKPRATEQAAVRKLHGHTEGALRRHREPDLRTTPTDSTIHNGTGCRLGRCGGAVVGAMAGQGVETSGAFAKGYIVGRGGHGCCCS